MTFDLFKDKNQKNTPTFIKKPHMCFDKDSQNARAQHAINVMARKEEEGSKLCEDPTVKSSASTF